jgi:YVTN family beta-propeller protein
MSSSTDVLATIPVDMEPRWVATASDGSRAYVTLEDTQANGPDLGAVAVIDTQVNTVTATITVGSRPSGVVITRDGRHAYVPNWSPSAGRGVVSVIDTDNNMIVDTITISGHGGGPTGVAITPDGRHIYVATGNEVAMPDQGKVTVIDTATNAVITTVIGNPFPSAVTITPNGHFAYVLDHGGETEMIDTATHEPAFLGGLVQGGGRMAFTPDGLHAYVVDDGRDFVEVLEVTTHKLISLVDVFGGHSTDVAVTPDGRHAYVTQSPGKSSDLRPVRVIDTATQRLIGSPVIWSGSGDGLAIMPDGATAYVADRRSRAVQVIPAIT